MADKKISQLTGATTPLSGTEVLPIVQSGATVKVANNDLRPKQIQSNTTSGVLQVTGPAAAATRVMTTPDANFSAARIDAGQTFVGNQVFNSADVRLNPSNGILASVVQNGGVFHQYYKDTAVSWVGAVGTTLPDSGVAQSAIVFSQYNGSWSQLGAFNGTGFTINNGDLVFGTAGKGVTTSVTNGDVTVTPLGTGKTILAKNGLKIPNNAAITVGTGATQISVNAITWSGLAFVFGVDGSGNAFSDLVSYSDGSTQAFSSRSVGGSPTARTYTAPGGQLNLAMGSGSYSVFFQHIWLA